MSLNSPKSDRYGRLDGAVLLGRTSDGEFGIGQWLWLEFSDGECVQIVALSDPSSIHGRFELMLPGETEPERLVDVRAVAAVHVIVPAGEALEVIKSKQVTFAGDEAFFIRFTPELLTLLEDVFAAP